MKKIAAAVLVAASSAAFAGNARDPFVPASAPTGDVRVAVGVRPGNHMPLVKCMVDGRAATMIFDTGASHTTLDAGFVRRELPGHKLQKVALGGTTNVERQPSLVHAASVKVGDAEFTDFDLMVLDLSHLEGSVGAAVDGIVGMNVIGRTLTLLSLGSGEAVFVPDRGRLGGFSRPVVREHPVSASLPPDPFSIDIVAEREGKRIPLFVDSASSITILEECAGWPTTGRRSAIGASDVNAGGNALAPSEGVEGELVLGIPLRIRPKILPGPGAGMHGGTGRESRIGADTLLGYDILIGSRSVAFRPWKAAR